MKRNLEFEFSAGLRWTHWLRAIAIAVLTVTGFYLTYVFIIPEASDEPILFLNAKFRMWHEIAGFLLIAVTLFKLYLFLIDKVSMKERIAFLDFISPKIWIQQIKYYLFMGEHPHLRGVYNPLQFIAYVGLYAMVFVISLTGLILYVHMYQGGGIGLFLYDFMRPIEAMMGGLAMVREIHHIVMWGILIFLPIHIYMAIFNSIMGKEGSMDAIISGYKFTKHDSKH
ncbi:MAG: Ni/Fe-hydrogenase, b-type cytochrome subunit [Epsilonproteobacteria bacterium]|uniref:Ni/Fe-hydrogenase, b-type cytochrome subunit n=1 Tax=Sulfurospirillum cavolei TaxID=366522 RepID=A0A2D3WCK8_9BACT|nr:MULTISPECIES: Ni/Fe-hydrogenase, b-type cytochrome subunit [Sulfurospirillum]NCB53618.1 Ni/Fe-hydrogenase, b-type cytochrome subunit [Campylobacterota bacterium]KHG33622.1 MAG: Ni/Fe hydrogenase [Sulfurospirillum sp. MES]MCD8544673.1 Ni/Fe-hydrogenase, b-type cytochrome subunit [Sulfurospirillum cavolei]MCP3651290.1 Ni/Fe-hydrogenase, b-type cytochrome subunit [Sulfurospirillum sp. DNRA8]MCR1810137.1 Ni/Fe-hydrogenase, b-type cytochrome subunit [Sulfurospirillum sp. DNRA8]